MRIIDAINDYSPRRFHARIAFERDSRSVELFRPRNVSVARFMAEIGDLLIEPDTAARVVIDARTGTVVIGQDVQISTVAVTHGTLNVRITETPQVSQPAPSRNGKTVVTPSTQIDVNEAGGQVAIVGGSSLRALVAGLNRLGVKPTGIIAILQAIKSAGALQADLVVQYAGSRARPGSRQGQPSARRRAEHSLQSRGPLTMPHSSFPSRRSAPSSAALGLTLALGACAPAPVSAQDGQRAKRRSSDRQRSRREPLLRERRAVRREARIAWQLKRLGELETRGQAANRRARDRERRPSATGSRSAKP